VKLKSTAAGSNYSYASWAMQLWC